MRADLKHAYDLIKAGRKAAAAQILLPILRAEPDLQDAWWLVSYALDDPRQIRHALNEVLRLDPFHEQAFIRLARLDDRPAAHPPLPTPSTKPMESKPAPKTKQPPSNGVWLVMVILLAIVGIGGTVGGLFVLRERDRASQTIVDLPTRDFAMIGTATSQMLTARALLPTAVPSNTLPPTWTLTPTPTKTSPPTLPPTWTASPSFTALPPSPTRFRTATFTRTPTLPPPPTTTPYPTINPSLFDQTYWNGVGDGFTMDMNASDGRYLRHFQFPIYIYVDEGVAERWLNSVNYAVNLLNTVIPMRRTYDEDEADIRVFVMIPDVFYQENNCPPSPNIAGCGSIQLIYDNDKGGYAAYGEVLIRENAPIDTALVVHEMMHALGVYAHSPNADDVMYPSYSTKSDGLRLSARDELILELLYSLPAQGEP